LAGLEDVGGRSDFGPMIPKIAIGEVDGYAGFVRVWIVDLAGFPRCENDPIPGSLANDFVHVG
jgi:hypothetical protein